VDALDEHVYGGEDIVGSGHLEDSRVVADPQDHISPQRADDALDPVDETGLACIAQRSTVGYG
jgi:hypothetical protein